MSAGVPVPSGGPPSVEVRVAAPDDLAQAGALTAEAYHADRLLDGDDGYEVELRDSERRAREAVLLVAVTGEVVVGTLTLAPYGSSYVEGRVVLSTLDAMQAAHRLYRRLGFVPAPERDWGHEGVALRVLTWRAPDAPGALVEAATWVPARTEVVDGWRVGISGGFTRRANSVLPAGQPSGSLREAVDRSAAVLVAAGLPPVFRVCSAAPAGLSAVLDGLGFSVAAATDVLVRDLGEAPGAGPSPAHLRVGIADTPDEAWLDGWLTVKAASGRVDRAAARAVVTGSRALYLTAVDVSAGERVVGVLRAALAEDWVGLSCLMVAPEARRRGIGRLLTERALAAAAARGARRAFLQVEVENAGAATLYAQQGFRPAERYCYRER